ncbi:MAG TPA: secondary thiamine-phosphate synthase enzyme YjbQ [Candidatus Saccharimonadales bacterium]|nr:secondary thiamine-phosphate synthase enzyme YjbQ [Candidatus Saccharimonadales bacterium]
MIITIATQNRRQVVDLTNALTEQARGRDGHMTLFVLHSTAAITTANLDPGTDLDLLDALAGMTPQLQWRHPHNPGHAPDHLLASIVGPSLIVPVNQGSIRLGEWQHIVLIDFAGPRECAIEVNFIEIPRRDEPAFQL